MNRLHLLVLLLLPVWAQGAYSQVLINGPVSIDLFTGHFAPFQGPNAFAQFGPGRDGTASAAGVILCDWCTFDFATSNTPGTSVFPSMNIEYISFSFSSADIGCEGDPSHPCSSNDQIDAGRSITFPTNGKDFAVTIPALEHGVLGAVGLPGGGEKTFEVGGAEGELALNFDFISGSPGGAPSHYLFLQGKFISGVVAASEPGPLGLMAVGLAGLLGLAFKRRLPALS